MGLGEGTQVKIAALMRWQEILDRGGVALLDGGTGSELRRRGFAMSHAAWSGAAALTHPQLLRSIHVDFIEAGADAIITNTFGCARHVLAAAGLADHFETIVTNAVGAATAARSACGADVSIAGSLSNLPPNLDPAGYPDRAHEVRDLRELARMMADLGVDLLALEMLQDTDHARRAMEAASQTGLPVWLGVSCRWDAHRSRLVSYDYPQIDFTSVLDALVPMNPDVVNIMHSPPDAVTPALAAVRERWSGPLGVYPELDGSDAARDPLSLVSLAPEWIDAGVQLIGGCCGTTPAHIHALRAGLPALQQ